MPFNVESLPALIKRARADLTPAVGSGALRRNDAESLARVHAGTASGLYEHQKWIADQILPDRCDEEMLLRLALLRLGRGLLPSTAARGNIVCNGEAGWLVPAGALYQTDDGRVVRVTADTAIDGNTSVPVEAVIAGDAGNLEPGTALTAVSPIDHVSDEAVVDAEGLGGGSEQETMDELRAKVIRSYRIIPHGGAADDYETWALEVPGVTRAWLRRNWLGPGTVAVFVMCDGNEDPFPDAAKLAEVQQYVERKRPTTAELYVLSPTALPVGFIIHAVPDTAAVRTNIERDLRDLIHSEVGLGTTLVRTHITQAISNATGEDDHRLLAPEADVLATPGQLITFGGIEWV